MPGVSVNNDARCKPAKAAAPISSDELLDRSGEDFKKSAKTHPAPRVMTTDLAFMYNRSCVTILILLRRCRYAHKTKTDI